MNKEEFKRRWELNDDGDGITWDDIAKCAKNWGLSTNPKTMQMEHIRKIVLKAAGVEDESDEVENE